ncbi:MAG: hypothetical protein C0513_04830 [Isosphaera sp.]|nr:hypothetical protein [Isosphaera sp.]
MIFTPGAPPSAITPGAPAAPAAAEPASAAGWLLGGPTLDPSDPGVRFEWTFAPEPWQWALSASAALLLAWWSYRRLDTPLWARAALLWARAALLMLLVVLLCGPRLTRSSESIEPDWVLVLVDRSASLTIADAPAGPGGPGVAAPSRTRDEQLRDALARAAPELADLGRARTVAWLGFDAGLFDLSEPTPQTPPATPAAPTTPPRTADPAAAQPPAGVVGRILDTLGPPQGRRSDLGQAIESALQRAAGRPVSGIVVLSDGRSTDELARPTLRRLAAERIGVYAVPLGSPVPRADVAVLEARAPRAAFPEDAVPVEVRLALRASPETAPERTPVRVRAVDLRTGRTLDQRTVTIARPTADQAGQSTAQVTLTVTPTPPPTPTGEPGQGAAASSYRVVVEPLDPTAGPDLEPGNNQADVRIAVLERPVRVLYLEGTPRWEYRFLKNVLAREKSVRFASLILSPGRRFIQEGTEPLAGVPATDAEWAKFDVIMLGDLRPENLAPEQVEQLRRRVSQGGAGLLWIAGPGAVPHAWRQSPLADLLPITTPGPQPPATFDGPVVVTPAPLAQRLGVLRLADTPPPEAAQAQAPADSESALLGQGTPFWPAVLSDPTAGWNLLYWAQRLDPALLKPAAEVLALAQPVVGDQSLARPVVVTMRAGAGRSVYVATDEVWRWRYARGDDLPERFYLQLVRLLGRESVARSGRSALVEITPQRGLTGRPTLVFAELLDQALIDEAAGRVTVRITQQPDAAPGAAAAPPPIPPQELVLRAQGAAPAGAAGAPSTGDGRAAPARRGYVAAWVPPRSGRYVVELISPQPAAGAADQGQRPTAEGVFLDADDERAVPQADHARLLNLAAQTDGRVVTPDRLAELPDLLPRRERRLSGPTESHDLWDTPAALIAVLGLLLLEWVGRRLVRLL